MIFDTGHSSIAKLAKQKQYKRRLHKGIGLIEALIAVLVMSIGMLGMSKLMVTAQKAKQNFEQSIETTQLLETTYETMRTLSYTQNANGLEGFLDSPLCNASNALCVKAKEERASLNTQLQKLLPGATLNIRHANNLADARANNFNNQCASPIFLRLETQNSLNSNQKTIIAQQITMYAMTPQQKTQWGLTCS
jgi:Tfp pilus assembly protein PilV